MGETDAIRKAKNILRGETAEPGAVLALVKDELKKEKAFDYARRVLARIRSHPALKQDPALALRIAQQQALCTYKDQNLSPDKRFDEALAVLDEAHRQRGETLGTTRDQESLGLAGAVNKYRWEISGQKQHLEQSLNFYLRGYECGVEKDYGYTAVNAAYVLDLLASLESAGLRKEQPASNDIKRRQEQASRIRDEVLGIVPGMSQTDGNSWLNDQWWFFTTIGEASFGSQRYAEAETWFKKGIALPRVPDWEKESTTRQITALARIQFGDAAWTPAFEESPAGRALRVLVGKNALRGMLLGKVGLALSGGGFRASLFHIGVLARLAELDMLRHVEVLSCVSGGSIIGAHYYLELRKLLREIGDAAIERKHYIDLVQRVERSFFAGVQRNLRTRVAAEFLTNLKMIFVPGYSRTIRMGELYEEELYSKVQDGEGVRPRYIGDIFVRPAGEKNDFSPKLHNWRREAKVPMLILNATTLNTGHNWQFTASWMGEPPAGIDAEIDANYRFRRMYYDEAPKRYRRIRLGHAVAASSCVPGLFEPLALSGLYPKEEPGASKITVQLVDGGVHDNQGVASLLEQGCSVMLVSDASGQMEAQDEPSRNLIGVPLRSNSILQARIRESEYRELDVRREAEALRGLMFIHLKKGLDARPVDWITCQEPPEESEERRNVERKRPLTEYGIQKDIQQALAGIRTDLDSFSQVEAYALMMSGYRMTAYEFPRTIAGYPCQAADEPEWSFRSVAPAAAKSGGHEAEHGELKRLLEAGSSRVFKIWKLYKPLKIAGAFIAIGALLAFLWASWRWAHVSLLNFGWVGQATVLFLAGLIIGKTIIKLVKFRDTLALIGLGIGMSFGGWLFARLHLHVFDAFFKKYSEVAALKKRAAKRP